jgi:hypothetical protein
MTKSLWYRLFRLGRVPRRLRPQLEAEGIILADEGIPGWLVTRRLRGPGTRYRYRGQGFAGSIVVTRSRVVCFAFGNKLVDVPFSDPRMASLDVAAPAPGRLSISFEAATFRDGWKGRMELRLSTPLASRFRDILVSGGAEVASAATPLECAAPPRRR